MVAASGLLLWGCSRSVESASQKFNELPPAVQKTVRAQAPNAEIADVSHKIRDGMDVYEVEFKEPGNPKVVEKPRGLRPPPQRSVTLRCCSFANTCFESLVTCNASAKLV